MGEVWGAKMRTIGAPAPYYHDIAIAPPARHPLEGLPPDAQAQTPPLSHWLHLTDGKRLRATHWQPGGAAKGTVLLFTGRTEYAEKYGLIALSLQAAGYAIATVDWRGQGLSDRLIPNPMIGHVERFGDYQRDTAALVAYAKALELPRPYHMLAHSMGGAIGLRALWQHLPVRSAFFTAPMWGIAMAQALRPAAASLTSFSQRTGFAQVLAPTQLSLSYVAIAPFELNLLTSDAAQYERLRAQVKAQARLGLGGVSMGWLSEALRENRRAARAPSPDIPCVTCLGGHEAIVDPDAVHARMGAWPKGQLHIFPKARHELLMEAPDIRAQVLGHALDLFNATGAEAEVEARP